MNSAVSPASARRRPHTAKLANQRSASVRVKDNNPQQRTTATANRRPKSNTKDNPATKMKRTKKIKSKCVHTERSDSCSDSSSDDDFFPRNTVNNKTAHTDAIINAVAKETQMALSNGRLGNKCRSSLSGVRRRSSVKSEISSVTDLLPHVDAWETFREHVRDIDVDSIHFQPKTFHDRGSTTLKTLMVEMGSPRPKARAPGFKQTANIISLSMRMRNSVVSNHDVTNDELEIEERKAATEDAEGDKKPRYCRGWAILRRIVLEKRTERRKSQSITGWAFLTKTIAHLTDQEKARQTLYQRYIDKPNTWAEGFSVQNYPRFLIDRQKKAMSEKRRVRSAGPTVSFCQDGRNSETTGNRKSQRNTRLTAITRPQSCRSWDHL